MGDRPVIKNLIDMQERLLKARSPFVRRFGALLAAGALDKHLSELRDSQVGQLMLDFVESDLRLNSPEALITNQASQRLLRSPAGRLEQNEPPPLICPNCGNDLLLRIGLDEPDSLECIDLNCKYKDYICNPEAK